MRDSGFVRNAVRGMVAASALFLLSPMSEARAENNFSFTVSAYSQAVAESVGEDANLAAFYRAREFAPIWTGTGEADRARRLALLEAFSMADDHGLPAHKYSAQDMLRRLSSATNDRERGLLEVEISQLFLSFAHDIQSGQLDPGRVVSGIKRKAPHRAADLLLTRLIEEDPHAVMRSLPPATPEYARLMRAKLRMQHKIAQGGWGPRVRGGKLKPGQSGDAVIALRNRLVSMGYLKPTLSARYDSTLQAAVQQFQEDNGLVADGVAGAGTLKEINVSPQDRLKSIIVAMERERWLNTPEGLGQRHVKVNLVDYHAQIYDDNKLTYETKSVIGHQDLDRRTPEFSDVMTHMVINPSWYVPRSIIVNEYLPLLRANSGAVSHLEVIDGRGRVVGRGRDFSRYSARSFPFSMRQPPGPRNALGSVKFMFPNKYNIYLHDTPSQSLFKRDVRTFSHGCIRLDDPHDFGYALLAKQEADPVDYFQSILRTRKETQVDLDQPVPVHLIYRTAFTEAKGKVKFRRDVYNRDARLWRALEAAGVTLVQENS